MFHRPASPVRCRRRRSKARPPQLGLQDQARPHPLTKEAHPQGLDLPLRHRVQLITTDSPGHLHRRNPSQPSRQ